MPLERCPKCDHRLGAPLKSSGRQVCMKCGWSDKPRQTAAATAKGQAQPELSLDEIKKLLAQAASEAEENMKPRNRKAQQLLNDLQQPPQAER